MEELIKTIENLTLKIIEEDEGKAEGEYQPSDEERQEFREQFVLPLLAGLKKEGYEIIKKGE